MAEPPTPSGVDSAIPGCNEVYNVTQDYGQGLPLVLVIDNERELLERMTSLLSAQQMACRCCTTTDEALAAAQESPPQLIICDVNLQGEGGLETCRQIKELPGLQDTPTMFLSEGQLPDIIRRSHEAGGIYCLRKPFDPKVLMELIDQALSVPTGMAM
jgi:CheY-like chemotaxis protein